MTIQLADEDIRERAYALWDARGGSDSSAEDDWHAAEEQLRAELDAASSPLPPLADKVADTLLTDEAPTIPATPRPRARPRRGGPMSLVRS